MTRLPCCIPFCRRTTAEPYDEWICGKHWSATSKRLRRIWFKRKRRWKAGDRSQGRHLDRIKMVEEFMTTPLKGHTL